MSHEDQKRPPGFLASGRPRVLLIVNSEWYFLSHRLTLAKALVRAGCHVTVAAPVERDLAGAIRAEGIRFVPLELNRGYKSLMNEFRAIRELAGVYRRERPDVVHQVTIKPVIYGSLAARWVGINRVINAVPGLGYTFAGRGVVGRLRREAMSLAYRIAVSGERMRMIFQNPEDRDLFVSRAIVPARQTVVIRGSGVDVGVFKPSMEPKGDPVILLPCRLLWDKGVGELVEATRILRAEGLRFRTVLVGVPDEQNPRSISRHLVIRWRDEGTIEWWGHREDMPHVFRTSSIVALPSYHEGLPRVLLEGAAAGRPLVATDIPGCREIVRDGRNGFLVRPRDPVALAKVLSTLIRDKDLRARMGAAGRAMVVREFSDERVIDQTIQVYREVLAGVVGRRRTRIVMKRHSRLARHS